METRYNYEMIRDYLHGIVDRETADEMSELIKNDEAARSIAEGILLMEHEFGGNEHAIEAYLEKFERRQKAVIDAHAGKQGSRRLLWMKIAATAAILAVVGYGLSFFIAPPDADELLSNALADPYPTNLVFRGPSNETNHNRAFQLYNQGNFAQAALYFEKATAAAPHQPSLVFFNALSSLYAGNYNRAVQLLQTPGVATSRFSQQARWYLALAYLKGGNKTLAVAVLAEISATPDHFKHDASARLLEALE